MKIKLNWDALGITTSIVCAIHCAVLPIIAGTLPIFGVEVIHNSVFEWSMIAIAFIVGSYSLFHGYITHHQVYLPVMLFSVGFVFLVLKQFFPQVEYLFLAIAVVFIITAHYYNYRLCNRSKCASPHHKH
jgi:hypothetical protein